MTRGKDPSYCTSHWKYDIIYTQFELKIQNNVTERRPCNRPHWWIAPLFPPLHFPPLGMLQREIQMMTLSSSFFAQLLPETPEQLLVEHCLNLLQENLVGKSDLKDGKLWKHYIPLILLSV